jgi:hypothetical protein
VREADVTGAAQLRTRETSRASGGRGVRRRQGHRSTVVRLTPFRTGCSGTVDGPAGCGPATPAVIIGTWLPDTPVGAATRR